MCTRFNSPEERAEWKSYMEARIATATELDRRFERLFGESEAGASARQQRELMMDPTLAEIAPANRLAVARQVMLVLWEHGLMNEDAERDVSLRAVSVRLGVPYLELYLADNAHMINPATRRDDLVDWTEWCQEHAPERLAPVTLGTPPAVVQAS